LSTGRSPPIIDGLAFERNLAAYPVPRVMLCRGRVHASLCSDNAQQSDSLEHLVQRVMFALCDHGYIANVFLTLLLPCTARLKISSSPLINVRGKPSGGRHLISDQSVHRKWRVACTIVRQQGLSETSAFGYFPFPCDYYCNRATLERWEHCLCRVQFASCNHPRSG